MALDQVAEGLIGPVARAHIAELADRADLVAAQSGRIDPMVPVDDQG